MNQNEPHLVPNSTERAVWMVSAVGGVRQAAKVERFLFLVNCSFSPELLFRT